MIPPEILCRCVFITGPTSVGKSAVALTLAQLHEGEIVCADAFQLYREFPVLSAQPSAEEKLRVPHHLYGTVSCADEMDAVRYAGRAKPVLEEILARGKTPFVVGGSGLYLQALISGLPQLPEIVPALREEVRGMTLEQMLNKLRQLDLQSLLAIDASNPRRVARRLELCLQSGKPASEVLAALPPMPAGVRGVFLVRDREDLNLRIESAVRKRLEAGAVDEVRAARERAGGTARQILGWREITALLDGKISRDECTGLLNIATRRYAKRQLTWFRGKSTFPLENISQVTPDISEHIARHLGLT